MLPSHSPSRVGANPLKSQPGSRKRPEAGTMGEGDRHSTGEALSRRPWPEPETGHSPVAAGLRRSRSRAEHKAPAGQRAALLSTRAHPPPDGRRSPELVPGGGRRSGVAHRAEPSAPRASTPATPAVAFVVRPITPRTPRRRARSLARLPSPGLGLAVARGPHAPRSQRSRGLRRT